jgi:tetratricopeptide (TPR) repeat protein
MIDPVSSEPTFEILILPQEPGARPRLPIPKIGRIESLRPERWLYVTHLLVLLSLAGLVVCIVGLVRLSKSSEGHEVQAATIARVTLPEAAASTPAPEPARDPSPEPTNRIEPVQPALAPQRGAEGPSPAGAIPQAAPPAPTSERVVVADLIPAVEPEPPPPPPAPPPVKAVSAEETEARKLFEEARSLEATNPVLSVSRYRKILELFPERTQLWKNIAELEMARGSAEEAARAYREFLRAHPDRADALQNLAVLDLRAGRLEEARGRLEAAIKAAPSADLYYNLGNVHLKAANYVLALASYRRALEYAPGHEEARFNLALALERSGRRAEAVAAMGQLATVSPEVARERARMESMLGGLEADRALSLARGSSDVEMIMGVASGFRQAGENEKALALLERAVDLAPQLATARLNRGAVKQAMGQLADAATDYQEAATLDPSLAEARYNLGVLAEERGQYVAALGHYAAALKANPSMACALNNVGALYLKVGQPDKAVDWFRRCRTASSDFTGARLNLAWAYLALGSKELALVELRGYTMEVPKDKRSADAVRVLAELEGSAPRPAKDR